MLTVPFLICRQARERGSGLATRVAGRAGRDVQKAIALDGARRSVGRYVALLGELLQHPHDDGRSVDLEVPSSRRAGVRETETVCAQGRVRSRDPLAHLVGD